MPPYVEHALGLSDVFGRVPAGERPGDHEAVAPAAAEEFGNGHAEAPAHGVKERSLHRAFGKVVADNVLFQNRHDRRRARRVRLDQQRRKVGVYRELDAFGAFRAIAEAADRRRLAGSNNVVRAMDANEDSRLPHHRRHGEDMWTYGWQIYQEGIDGLIARIVCLLRRTRSGQRGNRYALAKALRKTKWV